MKYLCKYCNYSTFTSSNFKKHNSSQKHINNLSDNNVTPNVANASHELAKISQSESRKLYVCEYCNKEFTFSSSLCKHKKNRCKNKNKLEDENNSLKLIIEENKQLNKELINYIKNNNNNKQITNSNSINGNNNNNKTVNVSVKNYIQLNYPNAGHLAPLENYKAIETNPTDLTNNLVYNFNHSMLDKYLGDFIVQHYKKDDPSMQSIWNSDVSRITYVIKELLANNKSIWNHDHKGIKTKEYIINPLLEYIKQYISEEFEKFTVDFNKLSTKECEKIVTRQVTLGQILQYINTGLSDDIVKYIGPHFKINKLINDDIVIE